MMTEPSRPPLVTLTEKAARQIHTLMTKTEKTYLRLSLKNAGCAGMEYVMDYTDVRQPLDELVKNQGVEILIDSQAVLFLIGTEIDYEMTALASRFVFNNPNQSDACGCGESVTLEAAKTPA